MIDNALKYNLGFCFRRKDAKGVNARELCFSGRHQNVATERTAEYGSLIGLQIPLPYLKSVCLGICTCQKSQLPNGFENLVGGKKTFC